MLSSHVEVQGHPSAITGTHFHSLKFLSVIHETYEKVLANEYAESGGAYLMEEEAFAHLLMQCA